MRAITHSVVPHSANIIYLFNFIYFSFQNGYEINKDKTKNNQIIFYAFFNKIKKKRWNDHFYFQSFSLILLYVKRKFSFSIVWKKKLSSCFCNKKWKIIEIHYRCLWIFFISKKKPTKTYWGSFDIYLSHLL